VRCGRDLVAGIEGRNLFNDRYGDPGSEEHLEDQIMQDGRALYASLTFRPVPRP
jgi:hypothetical protein